MGFSVGQFYMYSPPDPWTYICECSGPEAKWNTTPSHVGQICKVRDGWSCENVIGEGVWDGSDRVGCFGKMKNSKDKLLRCIRYTTKM